MLADSRNRYLAVVGPVLVHPQTEKARRGHDSRMLFRSDGLTAEQFNAKKANSSMSAECSLTVAKRVNSHGQGRQEPGVFAYTVDKVDGPGWFRYDLKIRVS